MELAILYSRSDQGNYRRDAKESKADLVFDLKELFMSVGDFI